MSVPQFSRETGKREVLVYRGLPFVTAFGLVVFLSLFLFSAEILTCNFVRRYSFRVPNVAVDSGGETN